MRRFLLPASLLVVVLAVSPGAPAAATTQPTPIADPALAARFFVIAFNQGTPAAAPLTPDFVFHLVGWPDARAGSFARFITSLRMAFPDLHVAVQTAFAQGDLVAARWTLRGTQDGPFQGIPATHRTILGVPGHAIFRVAGGKVAEVWAIVDRLSLLQQLGVFSGSAAPADAGPSAPAAGTPPAGDSEAIVRRFYTAYAADDLSALNQVIAPDWVGHPVGAGTASGRTRFDQNYAAWHAIFPDTHHVIDQIVATGDLVMVRVTIHGTQRGAFGDIPPTGKATAFEAFDLWRVANGQLAELWSVQDIDGLLQQLQGTATPAA